MSELIRSDDQHDPVAVIRWEERFSQEMYQTKRRLDGIAQVNMGRRLIDERTARIEADLAREDTDAGTTWHDAYGPVAYDPPRNHEAETESWRLWLRDRYARGEIELDELEARYESQLRDPQPAPSYMPRLPPPKIGRLPEERSRAFVVSWLVVWYGLLTAIIFGLERLIYGF